MCEYIYVKCCLFRPLQTSSSPSSHCLLLIFLSLIDITQRALLPPKIHLNPSILTMRSPHLLLFLPCFSFLHPAYSLPQFNQLQSISLTNPSSDLNISTSLITNVNDISNSLNELATCFPSPPFGPYPPQPSISKCALALRSLSLSPTLGNFHYNGPPDNYQLPIVRTYSSCAVQIELQPGRDSESASWLGIRVAANQLNMACVDPSSSTTLGGWGTTGTRNGIKITLRGYRRNGDTATS